MSFIKASAKGGEYERDVNATDAALNRGGNGKYSFSIHTYTNIIVFMSYTCTVIVNKYRFDAVNWGVTVAQISSVKKEKRIRINSNKSRNHD